MLHAQTTLRSEEKLTTGQSIAWCLVHASHVISTIDLFTTNTSEATMNKLFVEEQSALNGFRNSDVVLYGALASNEADQDPIDLAFLAAAAEANISLNTYSQTEFVPFDPKTRMTEAAI